MDTAALMRSGSSQARRVAKPPPFDTPATATRDASAQKRPAASSRRSLTPSTSVSPARWLSCQKPWRREVGYSTRTPAPSARLETSRRRAKPGPSLPAGWVTIRTPKRSPVGALSRGGTWTSASPTRWSPGRALQARPAELVESSQPAKARAARRASAPRCQVACPAVPSEAFIDALNEQIGNEFAASQQYVACAVYYDSETLPRLASFFYKQAIEERNHAMMMVQYILDSGGRPVVPATDPTRGDFGDIVEPVQLAFDQEKRVSEQINQLAGLAREQGDYPSEQFLQWFLKEQVEEVSSMSDLLTIVKRANGDALRAEEWIARESVGGGNDEAPTAPPAAGGAL